MTLNQISIVAHTGGKLTKKSARCVHLQLNYINWCNLIPSDSVIHVDSTCQKSVSNSKFQPKQDPKLWTPKVQGFGKSNWQNTSAKSSGCQCQHAWDATRRKLTQTLVGWFLNRKAYAMIPYMVCDVYLKFKMIFKKVNSSYTCLWMQMSLSASICFILQTIQAPK